MLTHKDAVAFAERNAERMKKDWDMDVEICIGYSIGGQIKKSHVGFLGFLYKILPKLQKDYTITEHEWKMIEKKGSS